MQVVTVDMETFWTQEYSLSKMSPLEYVMHPYFELICCSIKIDDTPTEVIFGQRDAKRALSRLDMSRTMLLGHNMSGFDSYVLAYRLGIRPAMWGCTAAMARPLHAKTVGVSLAKLVEHYGLGRKDNTVLLNTKGKRLADFTAEELSAMEVYNRADTDQCYALFRKLAKHYTAKELWQIDALTRMRTEPQFVLDRSLLEMALSVERDRKLKSLLDLGRMLDVDCDPDATLEAYAEAIRQQLASAPKFSALLEKLDIEVPMKPSPTNPDVQVPALAKTDEEFIRLQEHPNPVVAAAARARLEVKSTLLETRIEKFLTADKLAGGRLPIPLRYCGADTTGRDSGEEYNPQNLPRINPSKPKHTDALRRSLRAPDGYKVIVADQSGIELRVNHFLWQVPYSTELYRSNPVADLYRAFAARMYGITPEEVIKEQRQFAKVLQLGCFGPDTKVLTNTGVKRIVDTTATDKVWDGQSWVAHGGLVYQGVKLTRRMAGVSATLDHEILTERGWVAWQEVCENPHLFQSALSSASLPCSTGSRAGQLSERLAGTPSFAALVAGKGLSIGTTLSLELQRAATLVRRRLQLAGSGATGNTPTLCRTTGTALAYSIASAPLLAAATVTAAVPTTTSCAASLFATSGDRIGQRFFATLRRWMGGTTRIWRWIASTTLAGMSRATSASLHAKPTWLTGAPSSSLQPESLSLSASLPTYDLLNCGPNHRFTVITDAGPMLAHNCGFGVGASKFRVVAKLMGGIDLSEEDALTAVTQWREQHPEIVKGWRKCHDSLLSIISGEKRHVDPGRLVRTCTDGLVLPSGRLIRYPSLREEQDKKTGKTEWWYGEGRHKARIYAGKITENIVQALARDSIFDCAVEFYRQTKLRPALRVHDELVYVVPESDANDLLDLLQGIMRTPPKWWPELVVWSEGSSASTYGDAK